MADFDTSFYSTHCQDDSLSRYLLKRKPSTDSLRARLESLADPGNPKRGKQNPSKSPEKLHRSPRMVRISRKILKSKPQDLKDEQVEIKKITRERLFWHKQQENARREEEAHTPASLDAGSASNTNNNLNSISKLVPSTCFRPKHIGIQQLNAIRDQIQLIKQDLSHRYPELPSPKPDDWFREEEELDTLSQITNSSKPHRRASIIPHKSRAIVEKGVGSIQRKIKSIKLKTSHSSPTDLNPRALPQKPSQDPPLPPLQSEQASAPSSIPPSLTNFTISIGTPDTDLSQARFGSQQVSPNSTNRFPGKGQKIFRPIDTGKTKSLILPASITENDESHEHQTPPHIIVDRDHFTTASSTPRPSQLSIVTEGLCEPGPSIQKKPSLPEGFANHIPLNGDTESSGPISPRNWPVNSSVVPQWQNSAMEFLADDTTGKIDRWVFSSSLMAKPSDPSPPLNRPSHRLSLELPPRDSSDTRRRRSETESLSHQAFLFPGFPAVAREPSEFQFGPNAIIDPLYFIEKPGPSQVILATDVLIEQQGGLSFLGQENFNERFRSAPWQTVKTIRQYDRPGRPDAEYLPDVSRVAVVQTPHSTDTFPLPTPEWYWLTEFSIDLQSKPVDSNGWEYYDIFSRKWSAHRHGCRTFIRRRRWVRVRGKLDTSNLVNPAPADFHSARVSPPGEVSSDQQPQRTVVLLKKHGAHQSILFNSVTLEGGHSLTIELPGFPTLEVHWDDSGLAAQNPLFSSQTVAGEIGRYLTSHAGGSIELDKQEQILECLKDLLATINCQRVAKTVAGLSDPQKVNLWRYWLESDSSVDSSVMNKPEADDIWRVVERHITDVLGTFVFDFSRARFMNLVVDLYSRGCSPSVGPKSKGAATQSRSEEQDDQVTPLKAPRPTKRAYSRPTLSAHTFLKAGEAPSFLVINQIQLEYWNNLLNLFAQPNNNHPRRPFVVDQPIRIKLSAAKEIRLDFHKYLKSQNKLKRAATNAKSSPNHLPPRSSSSSKI
ncbi:hypothetical protein PGT21_035810 [Puccinia graminis f. sp. tritici]|uniref:Peroxin domain-containing protein n=1 Tax=Puccinia graminis f. sp. tritici TaxID=56615 RepID=A0A5B0QQ52_PUCGR|nr:hypothetical protein PGT21_035810 [Puccinia graminis f. sp. tritici]